VTTRVTTNRASVGGLATDSLTSKTVHLHSLSVKLSTLLLVATVAIAARKSDEQKSDEAYLALAAETNRAYFQSAEQAYHAELKFEAYIKDSIRRGVAFPDKKVLVWVYPRIALAAEYSGRKEEATRMFAFSETYAKQLYPYVPIDESRRFKTLREAVIYMDRNSKVPWIK